MKTRFILLMLLLVIVFAGFSEENVKKGPFIKNETTIYRISDKEQDVLIDQSAVLPGDIIRYEINNINIGDEEAKGIELTYPIPPELTYISGSVIGQDCEIEFSIDGGITFSPEPVRYIEIVDNEQIEKIAEIEKYTNILWKYKNSIMPDEEVIISFDAQVKKIDDQEDKKWKK